MIKQMAWNTFKNTGNINSYLEFVETENIEKLMRENTQNNQLEKNMNNNMEKKWEQ